MVTDTSSPVTGEESGTTPGRPLLSSGVTPEQLAASSTEDRVRANHTGAQAQSTVTGLTTDLGTKANSTDARFPAGADISSGDIGQYAIEYDRMARGNVGLARGSFSAYATSNQSFAAGAATQVVFTAEDFDPGGDYDTANSRFIAPAKGIYWLHAYVNLGSVAADQTRLILILRVNGATRAVLSQHRTSGAVDDVGTQGGIHVQLDPLDDVRIMLTPSAALSVAGGVSTGGVCRFSGSLVGLIA